MARPQLTIDAITEFRDAACRAALEVITTDGVAGLTLRTLGKRLGCSYAKPYRYFGDKDHLIDAVRGHAFDRFADFMNGTDPQSAALLPMQRYVQFALRYSAAFEVMFGFNQNFVSPQTRAAEDRAWDACTQPIRNQVQTGTLTGDPQTIGHVIWVALHGISTLALANKLTHGMSAEDVLAQLETVISAFRPTEKQ